ncbi:MAG: hypothetical protein QNK36_03810 [Colwellia sp.]|nr:hypothetical protein [Colwellia sp.]
MNIEIKSLININNASEKYKLSVHNILLHAFDNELSLYCLSTKDANEVLVPCKEGQIHHASVGCMMYQYQPMMDKLEYVNVQISQLMKLNGKAIKTLLVAGQFSEVELFRHLAPDIEEVDFWKTEREVYDWDESLPPYDMIELSQIQVVESQLEKCVNKSKQSSSTNIATEKASNTALKVIGLLMLHLAKSPKYALGGQPNKSQIKELLLGLASESNIKEYGLSKVDERLLNDAMKYLETQKN